MRLYLVRHGESEANKQYLHAGWAAVHLTEKGISDARKVRTLLEGIQFEKIFSSDLVRVTETCFYATGMTNQEQRQELRELNVGTLSGKSPRKLMEEIGQEYIDRFNERNYRYYDGENMADLYERVVSFLSMLEKEPYSSMGNILAFTSEGPITMVLAYVLGLSHTCFRHTRCDNGSASIFELQNNSWGLIKWNFTTSLL